MGHVKDNIRLRRRGFVSETIIFIQPNKHLQGEPWYEAVVATKSLTVTSSIFRIKSACFVEGKLPLDTKEAERLFKSLLEKRREKSLSRLYINDQSTGHPAEIEDGGKPSTSA